MLRHHHEAVFAAISRRDGNDFSWAGKPLAIASFLNAALQGDKGRGLEADVDRILKQVYIYIYIYIYIYMYVCVFVCRNLS